MLYPSFRRPRRPEVVVSCTQDRVFERLRWCEVDSLAEDVAEDRADETGVDASVGVEVADMAGSRMTDRIGRNVYDKGARAMAGICGEQLSGAAHSQTNAVNKTEEAESLMVRLWVTTAKELIRVSC